MHTRNKAMKRFDMEIRSTPYFMGPGESYEVSPYESTNGEWVRWDDVNKETISIPDVRVVETGAHDTRERFAVYVNDINFGIYGDRINAENYLKNIKRALGITIEESSNEH